MVTFQLFEVLIMIDYFLYFITLQFLLRLKTILLKVNISQLSQVYQGHFEVLQKILPTSIYLKSI